MKFKGFELVKILRAVTDTSPGVETDKTHQYEVEIYGMTGKHTDKTYYGIYAFKKAYNSEMGATTHRFAILQDGNCDVISELEYQAKVEEWKKI